MQKLEKVYIKPITLRLNLDLPLIGVTKFVICTSHSNRSRTCTATQHQTPLCRIYSRIWPFSPFHQALCCNWRPLWKVKTQTNWSDFHFVSLLWACPEWEIRSVIIQIKQQWETSNCSIRVPSCRWDRSQSSWKKNPTVQDLFKSIWRNYKRSNLLRLLWFWVKRFTTVKIFPFVVNILHSVIIVVTFGLEFDPLSLYSHQIRSNFI